MVLSHACFDSWEILHTFLYRGQWISSDCLISFPETFTVDDALEAIGFGKFQWKISLLTGLSWVRILKQAERSSLWFIGTVRLSCSALPVCEQVADAMEMMILSILGPQLHCEWRLPSYQVALITSVRFCQKSFIPQLVDFEMCKNVSFCGSGGVYGGEYQFTCMGECVGQVWQKNSEFDYPFFFYMFDLVIFVHYLILDLFVFCV